MTPGMTGAPCIRIAYDDHGVRGRVARVSVDNQARLNVLNQALMTEFVAVLADLADDDSLRAVVLTGAGGKAFIGGADIREMAGLDAAGAEDFITLVHRSCDGLRRLPVPVIARIDGYALGAGLEIAAACDLRVASQKSVFGMPEVLVGIPSVVEAALLPQLIGWGRTRQMLLTAENIGTEEAESWGLIEAAVPEAELDAAVNRWVGSILNAGPRAIRLQKQLIAAWEELPMGEAIRRGIGSFRSAWDTDEPTRLMRGFVERRRPK